MTKRLQYILVGLLAGLAFWGLGDLAEGWREARLFFVAVVAVASFGFGALAMLGELGLRRALGYGGAIALGVAALAALESLSFRSAADLFGRGHVMVALVVVALLPVPFAIAFGLGGGAGWRDYRVLFIESWNIVVRYAAAWLFVGVVFVVLWLLATLLGIVGVGALSDLLETPLAVWLIAGGTLGLGLSVVTEMSDMVSPYLLLRLLRLLLPLVLVVEVIFVAVLPLRGLTHLFGHLSAASLLLSTALASVALISIAVDQDDVEAAHGPVTVWAARGLAVLLPVLAGLAGWAVVARVQQYGWTPDRVMAAAAAAVVCGYAAGYAAAVLTGRHWMAWLRRANGVMALAVIGLGGLWLTPLISPEAIAARSQLARFDSGALAPEQLPLWEMAHDWGRAGERAVAGLRERAAAPGSEALAARLAALDAATSRWDMIDPRRDGLAARLAALRAGLVVRPEGKVAPEALLERISEQMSEAALANCARPTAAGNPGCVLVLADLLATSAGDEALWLQADAGAEPLTGYLAGDAGWQQGAGLVLGTGWGRDGAALIDALMAGAGQTEPAAVQALRAGAWQIIVLP